MEEQKKRGRPFKDFPNKDYSVPQEGETKQEEVTAPIFKKEDKVEVKKEVLESLLSKVEALEKKDEENQKQLKMLYSVADKGRLFNYENASATKKPQKIKLSVFDDKIITGWRTVKDRLIKNPTTGLTVGEEQEYEILLLGKDDVTTKATISSYQRFSDVRYAERIECDVLGKKEDFNGNTTFDIQLNDGRTIQLDGRFIN